MASVSWTGSLKKNHSDNLTSWNGSRHTISGFQLPFSWLRNSPAGYVYDIILTGSNNTSFPPERAVRFHIHQTNDGNINDRSAYLSRDMEERLRLTFEIGEKSLQITMNGRPYRAHWYNFVPYNLAEMQSFVSSFSYGDHTTTITLDDEFHHTEVRNIKVGEDTVSKLPTRYGSYTKAYLGDTMVYGH